MKLYPPLLHELQSIKNLPESYIYHHMAVMMLCYTHYNKQNLQIEKPQNQKMTRRDIEKALRDAGASRSFALSVAAGYRDALENDRRDTDDDEAIQALITKLNTR